MTGKTYLEEHAGIFLLQIFMMILLSGFLFVTGTQADVIFYVGVIWILTTGIYFGRDYHKQKKRFQETEAVFDSLEEKYLYTELLKEPSRKMEGLYFQCSRAANQAMMNKIEETKGSAREYKEYIESWIHEIKNPITAAKLYCANHPGEQEEGLNKELRKIEELVNQALYYARSGSVEKDYFVKKFSLMDALLPVLMEYRSTILEKHLSLEVEEFKEVVYTDPKWVEYIIGQLLSNGIKYVEENTGKLQIYLKKEEKGVWLCIKDNGCGIPQEDMPRIFEKGFTGSDRKKQHATGMGLYLAKGLSKKLGLSLKIDSVKGEGTTARLGFPAGSLYRP